jgi:hypothetical protein
VIHDIPTRSEPSIDKMRVKRSRRVGVRSIRGSGDRILLQLEIAIRDILTGESCGATEGVSGSQVAYHIGDREKASPESIDIRIRDPVNPEIPIEVTRS